MKTTRMSGFTLMELMIVLVLVALLSMGAWQGWQHWQQHQQLLDSARQIQHLLLRLRSEAWWHNVDRTLWLKAGTRWCLGGGSEPGNCAAAGPRWLLAPWPGVTVRSLTAELGFYGVKNTARPGSVVIASEAGERRIIVSSRGRIRSCSPGEALCR